MVEVVVDRGTAVHNGPSQFERLERPIGEACRLETLLIGSPRGCGVALAPLTPPVVEAEVVDSASSLFGRLVEEACWRNLGSRSYWEVAW